MLLGLQYLPSAIIGMAFIFFISRFGLYNNIVVSYGEESMSDVMPTRMSHCDFPAREVADSVAI